MARADCRSAVYLGTLGETPSLPTNIMKCKNCNLEHNSCFGSGIFCSRSCANSRHWSIEHCKMLSSSMSNSNKVKLANKKIAEIRKLRGDIFFNFIHWSKTDNRNTVSCKLSNRLKQTHSEKRKALNPLVREQYSRLCSFRFSLRDKGLTLEELVLIKNLGWYHPVLNSQGASRDHMFSISDGYKLGVDPMIVSHPENCRIIKFTDNQSKNSKSIISLSELLLRIDKYNRVRSDNN